jgi:hypothetical protein
MKEEDNRSIKEEDKYYSDFSLVCFAPPSVDFGPRILILTLELNLAARYRSNPLATHGVHGHLSVFNSHSPLALKEHYYSTCEVLWMGI